MPPLATQVYESAMSLAEEERAELASRLIESLPQDTLARLHPAWEDEFRRRLAQVDAGDVTPVSWEEVKHRAWEAVDRDAAAEHG